MNWLIFLLSGIIIGIIVGVLIDRDTVNKYFNRIRKVKIKNSENVSDIITIKQELKQARKNKRLERRERRKARKDTIMDK